jgi:hypothetical protein
MDMGCNHHWSSSNNNNFHPFETYKDPNQWTASNINTTLATITSGLRLADFEDRTLFMSFTKYSSRVSALLFYVCGSISSPYFLLSAQIQPLATISTTTRLHYYNLPGTHLLEALVMLEFIWYLCYYKAALWPCFPYSYIVWSPNFWFSAGFIFFHSAKYPLVVRQVPMN